MRPTATVMLAVALFAVPHVLVTFTQNCAAAVSGPDVNVSASVPTGLPSSPLAPWNHA